jgi:molecular chaperone GrpE
MGEERKGQTPKVEEEQKNPQGERQNANQTVGEDKELKELKNYIKTLEEKVKKLEQLAKVSNERYISLQRELEIVRSQHRRELEEKNRYGIEKFARDLLEVLDNFERALNHMKNLEGCKDAYTGVEMIYGQMKKVFEKHGITEIVVDKFDHSLCEAVSAVPTDEVEENTILEVVQKGYKLHDRVLRPAKVVVAVPKEEIT